MDHFLSLPLSRWLSQPKMEESIVWKTSWFDGNIRRPTWSHLVHLLDNHQPLNTTTKPTQSLELWPRTGESLNSDALSSGSTSGLMYTTLTIARNNPSVKAFVMLDSMLSALFLFNPILDTQPPFKCIMANVCYTLVLNNHSELISTFSLQCSKHIRLLMLYSNTKWQ